MAVVGTGTGITANIPAPPSVPLDSTEQDFWRKVDQFRGKADEAYTLWQKLRTKRQAAATNPELLAEYNQSMGKAENIQAKISDVEAVTQAVKSGLVESVKGWIGLEGIRHAQNRLGEIGILPVIAIAGITAAIAWIGSWLSEAYVIDRKLTAVENLTAGGMSAREAGDLIAEKGDPGALELFAGNLGTGIAVAGGVALLLYFFFEKKRGF